MDEDRRRRRKVVFIAGIAGLVVVALAVGGMDFLEFMESPSFCGGVCHTMEPEYTTYKVSPHSNVGCADCHISPGVVPFAISKLKALPEAVRNVAKTYDRPIETPVNNARPTEEACGRCHQPERTIGDIARVHTSYATDERNTEKVDTRVFKVGGGEPGVAQDIHWHIGADVWYLPLDEKRQEIGWVGVEDSNGELREFIDPDKVAGFDSQRIEDEKRLLDCVDCHSRPAHIFRSPDEFIDIALAQGKIDKTLPFIKREGLNALDPPNPSLAQAMAEVEVIKEFYKTSYPEIYDEQEPVIDEALEELKEIVRLTVFPYMKVTSETHIDNLGHQESPGCFRCHGTLVAAAGDQAGKVIDAGCNKCHYLKSP